MKGTGKGRHGPRAPGGSASWGDSPPSLRDGVARPLSPSGPGPFWVLSPQCRGAVSTWQGCNCPQSSRRQVLWAPGLARCQPAVLGVLSLPDMGSGGETEVPAILECCVVLSDPAAWALARRPAHARDGTPVGLAGAPFPGGRWQGPERAPESALCPVSRSIHRTRDWRPSQGSSVRRPEWRSLGRAAHHGGGWRAHRQGGTGPWAARGTHVGCGCACAHHLPWAGNVGQVWVAGAHAAASRVHKRGKRNHDSSRRDPGFRLQCRGGGVGGKPRHMQEPNPSLSRCRFLGDQVPCQVSKGQSEPTSPGGGAL